MQSYVIMFSAFSFKSDHLLAIIGIYVSTLWCWFQVGLAVVNGQLMAIGGFDGTTYLKTIEVYDPEQNCWKLYGGMNYRRLGGGVGVVKMPQHEAHLW